VAFSDVLKADADAARDDFAGTFRQTLLIGADTVQVTVSVVDSGDAFGAEMAGVDLNRRVRVVAALDDFSTVPVENDPATLNDDFVIVVGRPVVDVAVIEMDLEYQ